MMQQKIEQELQPYIKRNAITSIVDGVLNAMAMGLIPLQTLVVYFISGYVHSNLVIGLDNGTDAFDGYTPVFCSQAYGAARFL